MNDIERKFRLQTSIYIISSLPLFTLSSLFLSAGPAPAPTPIPVPFSLSWSHLSSCVSLCQSLSRFHLSLISPSPPPSQEWFQVSQFHLGHASCLQQSIRLLRKMASSLHRGPFHLDNLAPLP